MANVVFKKCPLFLKTLRSHPEAQKPLTQFIQHKSVSPTEPFGSKDYPYTAGALKGILHSKLGKDLRILYTISGKETKVIHLIGVFTHAETGTEMGNPSVSQQNRVATQIANQNFESKKLFGWLLIESNE